jgi:hypothetical protein
MFRLRTVVMSAKRLHHAGLPFDGHLAHPFRTRTARMLQICESENEVVAVELEVPEERPAAGIVPGAVRRHHAR